MGRLGMNILDGELFILCSVVVKCGYIYIVQYEWIYYSYGLYNGSKYTSYSTILN